MYQSVIAQKKPKSGVLSMAEKAREILQKKLKQGQEE